MDEIGGNNVQVDILGVGADQRDILEDPDGPGVEEVGLLLKNRIGHRAGDFAWGKIAWGRFTCRVREQNVSVSVLVYHPLHDHDNARDAKDGRIGSLQNLPDWEHSDGIRAIFGLEREWVAVPV